MRCARKLLNNYLGTAGAPLLGAVNTSRVISRILGGTKLNQPTIATLDSALSKTGGAGIAGAAAQLGRARALLSRPLALNSIHSALEDITTALQTTSAMKSKDGLLLHRYALALRLRALNQILDEKERLMIVSGAGNECEVATARGLVREAYVALLAVAPEDPFVILGYGEFELYEGNAKQALAHFAKAENLLHIHFKSCGNVADLKNCSPSALIAFKLSTALPRGKESQVSNALLKSTLEALSQKPNITDEEIASARAQLEAPESLTVSEVLYLAQTLDSAEAGIHNSEFFPLDETYELWHSAESTEVARAVETFMYGKGVSVSDAEIDAIRKKAISPFYSSTEELKKLLSSSNKSSEHVLNQVWATFGDGPKSQLSSADTAFWTAVTRVEAEADCNFSGGSQSATSHQQSLALHLITQLKYRAAVDSALALDKLGNPQEALVILDRVVKENNYMYMWKALLARGRVRQNVGLVNEADADFKLLFSLRKKYTGADIPLRDEHRTKSIF